MSGFPFLWLGLFQTVFHFPPGNSRRQSRTQLVANQLPDLQGLLLCAKNHPTAHSRYIRLLYQRIAFVENRIAITSPDRQGTTA